MGPAALVLAAAAGSTADPVVVAAITAILSGGGVGAVASYRRARGGAQLDVLSAAKVLYDELHTQNVELKAKNAELAVQRDEARAHAVALADEVGRCNERVDELTVRVEARDETIQGLQLRLDSIADNHH